jgi:DNA transformation protein
MRDESFKNFVLDQLSELPNLRARGMFGGFGLYSGNVFFGIISDDVLYFKTNEVTCKQYREAESDCFRPSEKQVLKNYYEVPADVLEECEILLEWAREAIGISV